MGKAPSRAFLLKEAVLLSHNSSDFPSLPKLFSIMLDLKFVNYTTFLRLNSTL